MEIAQGVGGGVGDCVKRQHDAVHQVRAEREATDHDDAQRGHHLDEHPAQVFEVVEKGLDHLRILLLADTEDFSEDGPEEIGHAGSKADSREGVPVQAGSQNIGSMSSSKIAEGLAIISEFVRNRRMQNSHGRSSVLAGVIILTMAGCASPSNDAKDSRVATTRHTVMGSNIPQRDVPDYGGNSGYNQEQYQQQQSTISTSRGGGR